MPGRRNTVYHKSKGFGRCVVLPPAQAPHPRRADRVDFETYRNANASQEGLLSLFCVCSASEWREEIARRKAKSEPISNLEDMVRICLLW